MGICKPTSTLWATLILTTCYQDGMCWVILLSRDLLELHRLHSLLPTLPCEQLARGKDVDDHGFPKFE